MADTDTLRRLWKYKSDLEQKPDERKVIDLLQRLQKLSVSISALQDTGIGKVVNCLSKQEGTVGELACKLVRSWKSSVEQEVKQLKTSKNRFPHQQSPPQGGTNSDSEDESKTDTNRDEKDSDVDSWDSFHEDYNRNKDSESDSTRKRKHSDSSGNEEPSGRLLEVGIEKVDLVKHNDEYTPSQEKICKLDNSSLESSVYERTKIPSKAAVYAQSSNDWLKEEDGCDDYVQMVKKKHASNKHYQIHGDYDELDGSVDTFDQSEYNPCVKSSNGNIAVQDEYVPSVKRSSVEYRVKQNGYNPGVTSSGSTINQSGPVPYAGRSFIEDAFHQNKYASCVRRSSSGSTLNKYVPCVRGSSSGSAVNQPEYILCMKRCSIRDTVHQDEYVPSVRKLSTGDTFGENEYVPSVRKSSTGDTVGENEYVPSVRKSSTGDTVGENEYVPSVRKSSTGDTAGQNEYVPSVRKSSTGDTVGQNEYVPSMRKSSSGDTVNQNEYIPSVRKPFIGDTLGQNDYIPSMRKSSIGDTIDQNEYIPSVRKSSIGDTVGQNEYIPSVRKPSIGDTVGQNEYIPSVRKSSVGDTVGQNEYNPSVRTSSNRDTVGQNVYVPSVRRPSFGNIGIQNEHNPSVKKSSTGNTVSQNVPVGDRMNNPDVRPSTGNTISQSVPYTRSSTRDAFNQDEYFHCVSSSIRDEVNKNEYIPSVKKSSRILEVVEPEYIPTKKRKSHRPDGELNFSLTPISSNSSGQNFQKQEDELTDSDNEYFPDGSVSTKIEEYYKTMLSLNHVSTSAENCFVEKQCGHDKNKNKHYYYSKSHRNDQIHKNLSADRNKNCTLEKQPKMKDSVKHNHCTGCCDRGDNSHGSEYGHGKSSSSLTIYSQSLPASVPSKSLSSASQCISPSSRSTHGRIKSHTSNESRTSSTSVHAKSPLSASPFRESSSVSSSSSSSTLSQHNELPPSRSMQVKPSSSSSQKVESSSSKFHKTNHALSSQHRKSSSSRSSHPKSLSSSSQISKSSSSSSQAKISSSSQHRKLSSSKTANKESIQSSTDFNICEEAEHSVSNGTSNAAESSPLKQTVSESLDASSPRTSSHNKAVSQHNSSKQSKNSGNLHKSRNKINEDILARNSASSSSSSEVNSKFSHCRSSSASIKHKKNENQQSTKELSHSPRTSLSDSHKQSSSSKSLQISAISVNTDSDEDHRLGEQQSHKLKLSSSTNKLYKISKSHKSLETSHNDKKLSSMTNLKGTSKTDCSHLEGHTKYPSQSSSYSLLHHSSVDSCQSEVDKPKTSCKLGKIRNYPENSEQSFADITNEPQRASYASVNIRSRKGIIDLNVNTDIPRSVEVEDELYSPTCPALNGSNSKIWNTNTSSVTYLPTPISVKAKETDVKCSPDSEVEVTIYSSHPVVEKEETYPSQSRVEEERYHSTSSIEDEQYSPQSKVEDEQCSSESRIEKERYSPQSIVKGEGFSSWHRVKVKKCSAWSQYKEEKSCPQLKNQKKYPFQTKAKDHVETYTSQPKLEHRNYSPQSKYQENSYSTHLSPRNERKTSKPYDEKGRYCSVKRVEKEEYSQPKCENEGYNNKGIAEERYLLHQRNKAEPHSMRHHADEGAMDERCSAQDIFETAKTLDKNYMHSPQIINAIDEKHQSHDISSNRAPKNMHSDDHMSELRYQRSSSEHTIKEKIHFPQCKSNTDTKEERYFQQPKSNTNSKEERYSHQSKLITNTKEERYSQHSESNSSINKERYSSQCKSDSSMEERSPNFKSNNIKEEKYSAQSKSNNSINEERYFSQCKSNSTTDERSPNFKSNDIIKEEEYSSQCKSNSGMKERSPNFKSNDTIKKEEYSPWSKSNSCVNKERYSAQVKSNSATEERHSTRSSDNIKEEEYFPQSKSNSSIKKERDSSQSKSINTIKDEDNSRQIKLDVSIQKEKNALRSNSESSIKEERNYPKPKLNSVDEERSYSQSKSNSAKEKKHSKSNHCIKEEIDCPKPKSDNIIKKEEYSTQNKSNISMKEERHSCLPKTNNNSKEERYSRKSKSDNGIRETKHSSQYNSNSNLKETCSSQPNSNNSEKDGKYSMKSKSKAVKEEKHSSLLHVNSNAKEGQHFFHPILDAQQAKVELLPFQSTSSQINKEPNGRGHTELNSVVKRERCFHKETSDKARGRRFLHSHSSNVNYEEESHTSSPPAFIGVKEKSYGLHHDANNRVEEDNCGQQADSVNEENCGHQPDSHPKLVSGAVVKEERYSPKPPSDTRNKDSPNFTPSSRVQEEKYSPSLIYSTKVKEERYLTPASNNTTQVKKYSPTPVSNNKAHDQEYSLTSVLYNGAQEVEYSHTPLSNNRAHEDEYLPTLVSNNKAQEEEYSPFVSNNRTQEKEYSPTPLSNNRAQEEEYLPTPKSDNRAHEDEYSPSPMLNNKVQEEEYSPMQVSNKRVQGEEYLPTPVSNKRVQDEEYSPTPVSNNRVQDEEYSPTPVYNNRVQKDKYSLTHVSDKEVRDEEYSPTLTLNNEAQEEEYFPTLVSNKSIKVDKYYPKLVSNTRSREERYSPTAVSMEDPDPYTPEPVSNNVVTDSQQYSPTPIRLCEKFKLEKVCTAVLSPVKLFSSKGSQTCFDETISDPSLSSFKRSSSVSHSGSSNSSSNHSQAERLVNSDSINSHLKILSTEYANSYIEERESTDFNLGSVPSFPSLNPFSLSAQGQAYLLKTDSSLNHSPNEKHIDATFSGKSLCSHSVSDEKYAGTSTANDKCLSSHSVQHKSLSNHEARYKSLNNSLQYDKSCTENSLNKDEPEHTDYKSSSNHSLTRDEYSSDSLLNTDKASSNRDKYASSHSLHGEKSSSRHIFYKDKIPYHYQATKDKSSVRSLSGEKAPSLSHLKEKPSSNISVQEKFTSNNSELAKTYQAESKERSLQHHSASGTEAYLTSHVVLKKKSSPRSSDNTEKALVHPVVKDNDSVIRSVNDELLSHRHSSGCCTKDHTLDMCHNLDLNSDKEIPDGDKSTDWPGDTGSWLSFSEVANNTSSFVESKDVLNTNKKRNCACCSSSSNKTIFSGNHPSEFLRTSAKASPSDISKTKCNNSFQDCGFCLFTNTSQCKAGCLSSFKALEKNRISCMKCNKTIVSSLLAPSNCITRYPCSLPCDNISSGRYCPSLHHGTPFENSQPFDVPLNSELESSAATFHKTNNQGTCSSLYFIKKLEEEKSCLQTARKTGVEKRREHIQPAKMKNKKLFEDFMNFDETELVRKRKTTIKCSEKETSCSSASSGHKNKHLVCRSPSVSASTPSLLPAQASSKDAKTTGEHMQNVLVEKLIHNSATDNENKTSDKDEPHSQPLLVLDTIGRKMSRRMHVYSGRKPQGITEMKSLYDLCVRVLIDNINAISFVGDIQYPILKPVLEKCSAQQLYLVESRNPQFLKDTDELWKILCERQFKGSKSKEFLSWRELYMRLHKERELKYQKLKQSMCTSIVKGQAGRKTQLAFMGVMTKPPREVLRRQKEFGTGFFVRTKTGH